MTPADFLLFLVFACNTSGCSSHKVDADTVVISICENKKFGIPVDAEMINSFKMQVSNGYTLIFHVSECKES